MQKIFDPNSFFEDISRFRGFFRRVMQHTHFLPLTVILIGAWMFFSLLLYLVEKNANDPIITSYGQSLYWGVAAFSTAGLASEPATGFGQLIGGVWIIVGSVLFLGTIVGTTTAYFMRPLETPSQQIVETIQDNLEKIDDLSNDELELLRKTVNGLISQIEKANGTTSNQSDTNDS